ncbi:MAG: hypothetical protein RL477_1106 [Pseudomonadota bacterium]|jgi:predicted NAD/FAD-binding protein
MSGKIARLQPKIRRERVAVIGSGAAGLAAAWSLSTRDEVRLFEAEASLGGHSNTVTIDGNSGPVAVDTGFIVFNPVNYPILCRAFDCLGVATQPSEMSFSLSCDNGGFEYSGRFPGGLAAQPFNLFAPRFWRMLSGLRRFYSEAMDDLPALEASGETLASYLERRAYPAVFRDDHLAPMAAAIWSQPQGEVTDMPAATLIRFFEAHGLLRLAGRPRWRTVTGGSREYVTRIAEQIALSGGSIETSCPVLAVRRSDTEVCLELGSSRTERFDRLVLAVHGDQALRIIADPTVEERRVLGAFRYRPNRVLLHSDPALMPRRRSAWAAWNFIAPEGPRGPQGVTYWMNRLQSLNTERQIFVTLNPPFEPRADAVLAEFEYTHPVFDCAAISAQRRLHGIQGERRTWFCGSYFGYGFHEDAFASGVSAARLQGVLAPWQAEAVSRGAAE